jgi:hypothetical protein
MGESSKLKLKYQKMLGRFKVAARIDRNKLSSEMAQNSALLFNVGVSKANAEYDKDKAESRVEVIEARIDKQIRKKASKGRKPSEAQIKTQVARHPDVVAAKDVLAEAKWKFNVCWAAVNSVVQKGDQLSNLAYNYRKELEHGLSSRVNEKTASERVKNFKSNKED